MAKHARPATNERPRIHVFDAVRGFSVISMVAFHLCYDLRFILGKGLPWFAPPLQDVWRASISWAFVFVAGAMCAWSRDNLLRSLRYLTAAVIIYLVTRFASVDVPISFGIIYCLGICTLMTWALDRLGIRPQGPRAAALMLLCFLVLLHVPTGRLGVGPFSLALPHTLYATPWLSWLGLPGPGFASGDYYTPVPFLFLYLAGASMGRLWRKDGLPGALSNVSCAPLELIGRHALPIYLLHQPALLLLLQLVP